MSLSLLTLNVAAESDRFRVLLRLDCSSEISRQETTLFANGTVRLRERLAPQSEFVSQDLGLGLDEDAGQLQMFLGELGPDELEGYLSRLTGEDLSESEETADGSAAGEWIEICQLELRLPSRPPRDLTFGRFDSLSLTTSRVVEIARQLHDHVLRADGSKPGFPDEYKPEIGDRLQQWDGNIFEVLLFTDGGRAVELQGLSQPITIIMRIDDLRNKFRRLLLDPR